MVVERALSFGSAAELYERFRPGYPDALVDLVVEDAPVDAIEIGAGTGKATRVVAARGVRVLAVEPDPEMIEVLARTTAGLPVTIVRSTLEALGPREPVDLLLSAAAWHWTDPATRWPLAASLLRPGGTFACVGGPVDAADPELAARIEEVRFEALGDEERPGAEDRRGDGVLQWPGDQLAASELFTDVRQDDLSHTFTMPADELVGRTSTVSSFLVAPDDVRTAVLARIRALLPDPVEVRRDLVLHRARRV